MRPLPTLPDLDLIRTILAPASYRAADAGGDALAAPEGSLGLMDVRFSPFNSWYRIDSFWEGSFLERTVPGTFKRAMNAHMDAKTPQIRSMFNHGMDMQIDQKLLGDVLDAREEADSPVITVALWDTSYNRDLLPGLRSGAYGSSFQFSVVRDSWEYEPEASDDNPDALPERTLQEVRVPEAGPVTWPANPAATAGMRCLSGTDSFYTALARRDPARVDDLRCRLTALRGQVPPADGTGTATGPANARPDDPTARHSSGPTPRQRREAIYPFLAKGKAS